MIGPLHRRDRALGGVERADDVDVERKPERLVRQLQGRLGLVDRCVVDDDIGHSEGIDDRAEGALDPGRSATSA